MKRIGIVGGAGFIESHLVDLCARRKKREKRRLSSFAEEQLMLKDKM